MKFFFAKERVSREAERRERKNLVTLASNFTFMQTTAIKRVKLLITKVTNGNLANTCFISAAICLSRGSPGEILNGMNLPSPLGW